MTFSVLITGGRDFLDRDFVWLSLDRLHRKRTITLLIHGASPGGGVDDFADQWARLRQVACRPVPMNDSRGFYGGRAGNRRNVKMADMNPTLVVAFPGGSGTHHMVSIAKERGIDVWQPYKRSS